MFSVGDRCFTIFYAHVFANLKPSIMLSGVVSLFCLYIPARTESEYDSLKYGDDYRGCTRRVPMWNIARGIIKERG
jgi:protein-S-isoprenylcysteine O-methyltransferase Ste14